METSVEKKISIIKQAVDHVYNIDIASKTRRQPYPEARSTFYAIVRKMFPSLTLTNIGSYTATHHATVLNGIKQREDTYVMDEMFLDREDEIRRLIEVHIGSDKGIIEKELEYLRIRIKILEKKLL